MSRVLGENLRRRAERLVSEQSVQAGLETDLRALLQELCVHQGGLEIQNEELREAQQAIERSRRQYMQLFESVPAACFTLDSGDVIGSTNRRAETLFGAGRRRLRGLPIQLMVERRDHARLLDYLAQARTTGGAVQQEFRFRRADGSAFDGLLDCTTVGDPPGGGASLLCGVVDVSERNKAVEAMRRATVEAENANHRLQRALDSKSRFLAAASHDLRQPVQALSLFVELLGQQNLPPSGHAVLGRVREAVQSLGSLLNGLLDVSKLEAGQITPEPAVFPAAALMRRLSVEFAEMARAKDIGFRLVTVEAMLESDPNLVERILRNLVGNAVRYTGTGGVLFGARRRGAFLRIEVWDTGTGIPEEHLELIFDDFHQVANDSRGEGLGLGLAIVARLAHLLACRVDVRSAVGRGSRFAIEVPLAPSPIRTE